MLSKSITITSNEHSRIFSQGTLNENTSLNTGFRVHLNIGVFRFSILLSPNCNHTFTYGSEGVRRTDKVNRFIWFLRLNVSRLQQRQRQDGVAGVVAQRAQQFPALVLCRRFQSFPKRGLLREIDLGSSRHQLATWPKVCFLLSCSMSWWTATMAVPRGTWINLGFLLILLHLMHQPVTCAGDSADYYTAAVVEFTPTHKGSDGTTTLRENSLSYVEYIEQASQQNADIIVFPEDGLTSLYMPSRAHMDSWATVIPSPLENYIPCTENRISNVSETLKRLSCAARQNRIYVVVNIAEKEYCEPKGKRCADGVSYHNTNVVFDRSGAIVARYRKVNLYMEYRFDTTEEPEIVTFDTDFGVTFGTFICFDILFWVPALNLTRMRGVSNFVYTTAWFSEVPFLTAVQTQFAWSFAENANLLVSGYHDPINGNAGSGIYLGRKGIANATITASPLHRLLISRVPKKNEPSKRTEEILIDETIVPLESFAVVGKQPEEKLNLIRLLHDNLTAYESVPLEVSMTKKLCYRDFCCDFDVRTSGPIDPRVNYRAVVYDGVRLYGAYVQAGVRVCAVIQCKNQSFDSCGSYQSSDTTFTTLNITATYPDYSNILAMPSVLDHSLFPIEHFTYTERPHDGQTSVSLALKQPTRNLVTFGLYARDFTKDREDRP